MCYVCGKL